MFFSSVLQQACHSYVCYVGNGKNIWGCTHRREEAFYFYAIAWKRKKQRSIRMKILLITFYMIVISRQINNRYVIPEIIPHGDSVDTSRLSYESL